MVESGCGFQPQIIGWKPMPLEIACQQAPTFPRRGGLQNPVAQSSANLMLDSSLRPE
jgi:hypothetical protein